MSLKILAQNVFHGETYTASEGFYKSDLEVFSIETSIGKREKTDGFHMGTSCIHHTEVYGKSPSLSLNENSSC